MTGTELTRIPIHGNGEMRSVCFMPDGRHIVGGQSTGYLRQWKTDSGEEFSPSTMKVGDNVYAIAVSADGRWIVSGSGVSGQEVVVWDAVTHQKAINVSSYHASSVFAVDVSSDSTRIASGSRDCTAQIFDIVSGSRVIPPLQHSNFVVGVKFSPDGTRLATAMFRCDRAASIYDAHSGNMMFNIMSYIDHLPVTPLAWSPDNKQLFVVASRTIVSFDTSTSYRSEWFAHDAGDGTSIVSHGRFIAHSAARTVLFWDYASHERIGATIFISCAEPVNCISVSLDGRYLACGHNKGITVHDLTGLLPQAYFQVARVSRLIQVSPAVLKSWLGGNQADTESMLSKEIAQASNPNHHTLAARSLIRSHLKAWKTAIEDAELSLQIKTSPVGHVARTFALIGAGKQDVAFDDFDMVFHGGDPNDNTLLLVIKSILMFMCGKHEQAVSRLRSLITTFNESHLNQVLGNMFFKRGDYESATKALGPLKELSTSQNSGDLATISLIFNWDFDNLAAIAWKRLCETLYASGRIEEVGEALEEMVSSLGGDEEEAMQGRILQEIVTRSGQVTLLAWTGTPSACNSCLPCIPSAYSRRPYAPPCLEGDELKKRVDELRKLIPLGEAMLMYGRMTRLQPIRFTHFRLLLPCAVFGVTRLTCERALTYRAETAGLGDVEFTTDDSLPLEEPQRFVFADLRIHSLQQPRGVASLEGLMTSSGTGVVSHAPIIEEVPPTVDAYTRALELISKLGQPFSALLLLQQPEGAYKRVASDREIVVQGLTGNNIPTDIRVEVLEIL